MDTPFLTSVSATSCGVETMTAPAQDVTQHRLVSVRAMPPTVDVHELPEREGHVARAGRHVDDEGVEARTAVGVAPVDVEKELLHGLLDHEPAPDDGRIHGRVRAGGFGQQEAHGHARETVVHYRHDGPSCQVR